MKGFTLVELLIVVAILGVLASTGFLAFSGSLNKSRDGERKAAIAQTQRALELYVNDYGVYPESCENMIAGCGANGTEACSWGSSFSAGNDIYMQELPEETKNGWDYIYRASGDGRSYQLYVKLEVETDPDNGNYPLACTDDGQNCTYGATSQDVTLNSPLSTEPACL